MADETVVAKVAFLLWCLKNDFGVGEGLDNHFLEDPIRLHPDDRRERPQWIAAAEEIIGLVREDLRRTEVADELDRIAATIRRGDENDVLSDGWTSLYADLVEKRAAEIRGQ